MSGLGVVSASVRAGHPHFLDLPWHAPLGAWRDAPRLVARPAGESRHPVVFVEYPGGIYALKGALRREEAEEEYRVLRALEDRRIPAVRAVGHLRVRTDEGEQGVLVTRYLEHAIPYHALFTRPELARYRPSMRDALAGLLVELHLSGVFWGDCSLFNALFVRDAGELRAYLVDAETSSLQASLPDRVRTHELELMEENVGLALADLVAMGALPEDYPVLRVGAEVRARYDALWAEVATPVSIPMSDRFRIEERIRALNRLGFSVGEIELSPVDGAVQLEVMVTDRSFHADLLRRLTSLRVQEGQARQLVNEIRRESPGSVGPSGLAVAARQWLEEVFRPVCAQLAAAAGPGADPAELYCQLLEHKWYLSEQLGQDVGRERALADFLGILTGV